MEKYNGDIINPEYVEFILNEIQKGNSPYIDIFETEDAYDYLTQSVRTKEADILIKHALKLHPDSFELQLLSARIDIDNDNLSKAQKTLHYLASAENNNPDFYVTYGWLKLKQHQMDEAIKHFDKACQYDDEMYYEIGMNLNQFGNHDEAKRFLLPYVKKHPDDPEALFELAYAYEQTNMTEKAKETYEELVDKSPFYPAAWYNLGIIYNNENEFDKAIMAYDTAVTINPNYPEPYYNMGNTYMNLMQFEKALNCYLEYASFVVPTVQDASVMQYIGECWWELGNYNLSQRFYKKAIDAKIENPSLLYGYALCCIELNNNVEALRTLDKLIVIDPEGSEYYFAKAQVFYNMMDKQSALTYIMTGIKFDPEAILAWHEALRLYCNINGQENVSQLIKDNKTKYSKSWAFKFITFVVQFCFEKKYKTGLKTFDNIVKNNPDIIYEASEDETLRKILLLPECKAICKKYDVNIEDK